ncbi:MAG: phosphoenolpyruvate--protein phosphotransferase [Thiomargarita sp.]|nr:phosphoenolpyruvate--protein phosphotransferase [Thiomargarita sp.]
MTFTLHGIGVSKGIAIGKVHIIEHEFLEIPEYCLPKYALKEEIIRFENAIITARQQLYSISKRIPKNSTVDVAVFIDAHLLMLEDSLLTKIPIDLIHEHQCNAEWALKVQSDNIIQAFNSIDDPYLSARKNDVEQVVTRVQRVLLGYPDKSELIVEDLSNMIVLADDLSPADTILMQHNGIYAFVTEYGGTTSHTAILARSLGIPAIVGLRQARPYIKPDDVIIVDGLTGTVIVDPGKRCLRYYRMRQHEARRYRDSLSKIKNAPTITLDGVRINLQTNIEFPEDMLAVKRVGGKEVGLYRTEFLFMNRIEPPDEEEHLAAYTQVINALKGGVVTIRTLDLGADKQIVDNINYTKSSIVNPALGLRGIRLCLKEQKLLKSQLRAILRASILGNVQIMIPMVSGLQELIQVRHIFNEVRTDLSKKSIKFDPDVPCGVMVEIPAIALCIDLIAHQVDFLSLGTNDLIQYTLAIDRGDEAVNYLYEPLHPAVLRLIKISIDAANKADKPISMCGEMASDSRYVRLLLGLGLRTFSVNPESFLEVKKIINDSNINNLEKPSQKMLNLTSQIEATNLLEIINKRDAQL